MARWEQYEIWVQNGARWEMLGFFRDFEVAKAMASRHSSRMRLIRAVYQDGKIVEQDILAELGTPRRESA